MFVCYLQVGRWSAVHVRSPWQQRSLLLPHGQPSCILQSVRRTWPGAGAQGAPGSVVQTLLPSWTQRRHLELPAAALCGVWSVEPERDTEERPVELSPSNYLWEGITVGVVSKPGFTWHSLLACICGIHLTTVCCHLIKPLTSWPIRPCLLWLCLCFQSQSITSILSTNCFKSQFRAKPHFTLCETFIMTEMQFYKM